MSAAADTTVPQAFAASAARHAARVALVGEDGRALSYAELDAARIAAARALIALGVQPGERVAIWAPNGVEWVIAGLAIHSVGAVLVPVNTRMKGTEAADVLLRSGARVLFCAGRFLGTDYPALLAGQALPQLTRRIVFGQTRAGEFGWRDFLACAAQVPAAAVEARSRALTPADRMDVLYTSGTTGIPKGVVTGHGQNLRVIAQWSQVMDLGPDDQYLVVNPFFHSFGYKVGWLAGLLAGCTVRPHAAFDARALLGRIARERISVLPGPPTLFVSLLDEPARAQTDLSSLRATITGAAAVAPVLIERIRAELGFKIVLTGYGLTETCGVVTLSAPQDDAQTIATSCGRPIPGVEVRIVSADQRPLAAGETGEVLVRGYNVMQGYLDDPQATRAAIDAQGFLHTGDVGCLDARGYLRITDRLKDMYITGGFNCYPAEIERALAAHPALAQVAVIGTPDTRLGEVGKAFVVLRPGAQLTADELIAWARERMANYKVPRAVEFVASLPTNAAGKVLKYRLREMARGV
jgi:acyl-CoA synthetase (AMP-forming)/AMP-acid ligase II